MVISPETSKQVKAREGGREGGRGIEDGSERGMEGGREERGRERVCQRIMRNDTNSGGGNEAGRFSQSMHTHNINNISRLNIEALFVNALTLTFLFSFQMSYLVNECF